MAAEDDHKLTSLIHDWADGNEEAAGPFFETFSRELQAAARKALAKDQRLKDIVEPGDLINSVFLKLDRGFKGGNVRRQFLDRVDFRNYVISAMRNVLTDMSKEGGKEKPRRSRVLSLSQVANNVEQSQVFETIEFFHTLDSFGEKFHDDVDLLCRSYLLEETNEEIADSMGISRATLNRRMKAAKQSFAARYKARTRPA